MVINVTYDLKKPGQDYSGLIEEIKKLGSHRHDMKSTWLVDTGLTPEQVWERLRHHIDQNDSMLIIEVKSGSRRHGWLPKEIWDWLDARI